MLSLLQKTCIGFAAAALAWGQTSANAQFAAAYRALLKKDYDSAIVSFRSGLKEDPANSQARKDLAYTLLKTGESTAAREEFRTALNLNQRDERAALEYAFLADETGQPEEARRVFKALSQSGSPEARKTAGTALININKEGGVHPQPLPPMPPIDAGDSVSSTAPIRPANLWAFFDSAYRMRADVNYLAKRWSDDGISLLFVAAWHNMQPDPAADEYLNGLIAACHQHGILVYAWLELPYVSEKFWTDHPEWREKDGLNQDAQIGWRKLMNLQNPDCRHATEILVDDLLKKFDWDGVNVAELGFEGAADYLNAARFTPLNENVRTEFKDLTGFDPLLLFDPLSSHANEKDRATFLKFRTVLEARLQSDWLNILKNVQKEKPHLDVVLTVRDAPAALIIQTPGKQKIGVDLSVTGRSRAQFAEDVASASKPGLAVALPSESAIGRSALRAAARAVSASSPTKAELPVSITAFSADLQSATVSKTEVDIAYQSRSRAPVTFDESVRAIEVDGAPFWKAAGKPCSGWAMLPAGQHVATFISQ
jgi:tetratricopeptide (TPR) repeat protein